MASFTSATHWLIVSRKRAIASSSNVYSVLCSILLIFWNSSFKSLITSIDRSVLAASISERIGLKARGVANKILSISPWPWSIFAMSCVEPRMLKAVFADMCLVSSFE